MSATQDVNRAQREILDRIEEVRRKLGKDVVVLGHHYQTDDVIRFADYRGDSLELSRVAASLDDAAHIVFCGVDFMAESAALLCDPSQQVYLPSHEARCPMAGMAGSTGARHAWDRVTQVWGSDVIPITYQNSSAELKAFCGQRGGAVCTSSNASAVFEWALAQKGHILFFPDEHLGRNTALSLGIAADEVAVWDPEMSREEQAGLGDSRVVVWMGYCYVHTFFTVGQVERARERYPDARVIVHPECTGDVVAVADASGSTSYIVREVEGSPPGSTFVIGTEKNLVSRLATEHPDKRVVGLAPSVCDAMSLITPENLLSMLNAILEDRAEGAVRVSAETIEGATLALDRMLAVR